MEGCIMQRRRKLNVGCGNDYRDDFWNIDIGECKSDEQVDIAKELPFEDDFFDMVFAQHVLEHIPKESFFKIFKEIHRVMAKGAILEFIVPIAGSDNFWTDPTHTMPFTTRTMDFFIKDKPLRENGVIYGVNYEFIEVSPPEFVDQVGSLKFLLEKA